MGGILASGSVTSDLRSLFLIYNDGPLQFMLFTCISLCSFPNKYKDNERWKVWFRNCRRDKEPNKRTKICSVHFDSACFKQTPQRRKLKDTAVPTLFDLPRHLQVSTPTSNSQQYILTFLLLLLFKKKTANLRNSATSKRASEPFIPECTGVSAQTGASVSVFHSL